MGRGVLRPLAVRGPAKPLNWGRAGEDEAVCGGLGRSNRRFRGAELPIAAMRGLCKGLYRERGIRGRFAPRMGRDSRLRGNDGHGGRNDGKGAGITVMGDDGDAMDTPFPPTRDPIHNCRVHEGGNDGLAAPAHGRARPYSAAMTWCWTRVPRWTPIFITWRAGRSSGSGKASAHAASMAGKSA